MLPDSTVIIDWVSLSLFNGAVSISDYTESNDLMIINNKLEILQKEVIVA
jgi:hypothetical protein